jgi:hypothetical protein
MHVLGSSKVNYGKGYALTQRFVGPLQMGITRAGQKTLLTAVLHYNLRPEFDYAVEPQRTTTGRAHPIALTLGLLKYVDLDRSARTEHAFRQHNAKRYLLETYGKMSAFYWGLGPSAAIQVGRSDYLREKHPVLWRQFTGGIMPDATFGYHFARSDLNVGISYRFLGDRIRAWDSDVRVRRHSMMVESYKFLFNYLGFVPFAGVTISWEDLQVRSDTETYREQKPALGLIMGWDIRVTRTGSSLLRTNLRYIPGLDMQLEGRRMRFDHLEFNFIQYVHYIGRHRFYQRFRQGAERHGM